MKSQPSPQHVVLRNVGNEGAAKEPRKCNDAVACLEQEKYINSLQNLKFQILKNFKISNDTQAAWPTKSQ